jgi:hypothetical protein
MVYFQSKNPNFGKFWSALGWKMLMFLWPSVCNILRNFWVLYDHLPGTFCVYLVHFYWFWYHGLRKIWQSSAERKKRIWRGGGREA